MMGGENEGAVWLGLPVGTAVSWQYVVTNAGNIDPPGVTVDDDQGVTVTCPQTDLSVGSR